MKKELIELFKKISLKKMYDISGLIMGIFFFAFSMNTIVFHIQYNSLPHVESMSTIIICSFWQGIIIILSSLLQILHTTHNLPTSLPFHYFTLFVVLIISITHSIILIVSLHHFNRIDDNSHLLEKIESQYSCCGWTSINTMICKSLSGIRADRTCSSTIGTSFRSVLPSALTLNIIEIFISFSYLVLSYFRYHLTENTLTQVEETEDPADVIINYLNIENEEEETVSSRLVESDIPSLLDIQPDRQLFSSNEADAKTDTSFLD